MGGGTQTSRSGLNWSYCRCSQVFLHPRNKARNLSSGEMSCGPHETVLSLVQSCEHRGIVDGIVGADTDFGPTAGGQQVTSQSPPHPSHDPLQAFSALRSGSLCSVLQARDLLSLGN